MDLSETAASSPDYFCAAQTECNCGWGICLQFTELTTNTKYQSKAFRACKQLRHEICTVQIIDGDNDSNKTCFLSLSFDRTVAISSGEPRWPLICFLALSKQQSNNHRTEDFVSEVYFWSSNWTSKSCYLPVLTAVRCTEPARILYLHFTLNSFHHSCYEFSPATPAFTHSQRQRPTGYTENMKVPAGEK